MQTKFIRKPIACAALALVAACSNANPTAAANAVNATAADGVAPADGQRLAASVNANWITLTGKVISTAPESFQFDYGKGQVTVEMDDWDWFDEGRMLKAGDQVTVSGRVDKDFLERKKIEASTVYVQNLGTHFFASGQDEEDFAVTTVFVPQQVALPTATGMVTEVEGREFVIGSADSAIRVDTSGMADNPLDATGFRVKIGDRVQTWGPIDVDPKERPEIAARGVVILSKDSGKTSS